MVLEALPNIPSFAPTEPSSTKNISSAIGGSTSTAQKLKDSTLWTKILLLNVKLPPPLDPKDLPHLHKDHTLPQAEELKLLMILADKDVPGPEGSKRKLD